MNQTTYDTTCQELLDAARKIVEAKRPEYTQDNADVLHNFKQSGEAAGITPLQAWVVHMEKQYSAVCRAVKNPAATPSEGIQSRFCDLINYLQLGYALFVEKEMATTKVVVEPEQWHNTADGWEPVGQHEFWAVMLRDDLLIQETELCGATTMEYVRDSDSTPIGKRVLYHAAGKEAYYLRVPEVQPLHMEGTV